MCCSAYANKGRPIMKQRLTPTSGLYCVFCLILLAGCRTTSVPVPNRPPVVIDIHTHLFNAKYVPLRESRGRGWLERSHEPVNAEQKNAVQRERDAESCHPAARRQHEGDSNSKYH